MNSLLHNNLNEPVPSFHQMDEALPGLKTVLAPYFNEAQQVRFAALLQETGALLAGGSVLRAHHPYQPYDENIKRDLDIYVPIRHIKRFLQELARGPDSIKPLTAENSGIESSYKSSCYCASFLRRNGIQKVYNFHYQENDPLELAGGGRIYIEIDVMAIRNRRTPLQVVQNFDLTFCQTWYDGVHIYATHPEHIRAKKGILQGDYVKLYCQGNQFLKLRLFKYGKRGFKVMIEEIDLAKEEAEAEGKKPCFHDSTSRDEKVKHWASRALLTWCVGARDRVEFISDPTPSIRQTDILVIPMVSSFRQHKTMEAYPEDGPRQFEFAETRRVEDGYDSEDYLENEPLKDLVYNLYPAKRTITDLVSIPPPETNEATVKEIKSLLFHRAANKLFEIAYWPCRYKVEYRYTNSLGRLAETSNKLALYYEVLMTRCIRIGTSYISMEETIPVFDIHEHPMQGAISTEDMEGYLGAFMSRPDKSAIPCYYKPEVGQDHPGNCQKTLSLSEIKYMVSPEFYERFATPPPVKQGLNLFMDHYDQTLQNAPSNNATGFGMIYHHTVCPYCLQFESRESGCAYITHDPASTGNPDYPCCNRQLQYGPLVARYLAVSDRGAAAHLEFCVECGRPCVDHAHITTTAPYQKIADAIGAGGHIDFGKCTGGGRAELFARILAIRQVYRDGGILDSKAERIAAIQAADAAPNDPALLAAGTAIAAQEEATRHWTNAAVPKTKPYTDPAYRGSVNNNNNNNNNNGAEAGAEAGAGAGAEADAVNGGSRYKKTFKKHSLRKRKRTRKH